MPKMAYEVTDGDVPVFCAGVVTPGAGVWLCTGASVSCGVVICARGKVADGTVIARAVVDAVAEADGTVIGAITATAVSVTGRSVTVDDGEGRAGADVAVVLAPPAAQI
jgi:hypothetical protein